MTVSLLRRAGAALGCVVLLSASARIGRAEMVLDRSTVAGYARKQSPASKAAVAQVSVAKAGTVGVGVVSLTNPSLTVMGGVRYSTPKTPEVNATLMVPVDLGGRPGARVDAAEAAVDVAHAQAGDALRGIVREALLRWARALRAERATVLSRARRDVAATLVATAKRRAQAGEIAKGDSAVFEVELGREEARVAAAEGNATARRLLLTSFVNAPPDARVGGDLVAKDALPGLDALLGEIDKRPDVQAAISAVKAAKSQVVLAKADAWPTLGVVGNYEYHESTNFLTVGVAVPLPLFNVNKTAVATGNAKTVAAEAELAAVRAGAIGELKAAWAIFGAARAGYEALSKVSATAEGTVTRTLKAYDVGTIGVTDVLLVRRTAQDAATELLDAELALAEARIDLEAAAGRLP